MRNLLLAVLSFLAALVAVELVLRATHAFNARAAWTEPDRQIGWRFTPGREYWFFAENDHAVHGRINAMGWRDRERTRAKPAGTVRVAVLGDSYVEAFQVELDSTFVAVAERRANALAGAHEFLNFGRSGMGPAEELIVLERDVLPCEPDAVVLLFTPRNDLADVGRDTATQRLRPFFVVDDHDSLRLDTSFRASTGYRMRAWLNPLKQRSALVSLVFERYNAWRAGADADATAKGTQRVARLTPEETLLTAHADSVYAANYVLAKRLIAEMTSACRARGVGFVLMSAPLVYEDDAVARLRALDATLDPAFFDRDLGALADSLGGVLIPLAEAFRGHHRATGERLHWAHWNYTGHRLAGSVLADSLVRIEAGGRGRKRL